LIVSETRYCPSDPHKEEDEETQDVLYVEGEILPDGKKVGDVKSVAAHKVGDERYGDQAIKEPYAKPDNKNVGDFKLDEDGNKIPEYQGIDQSKLVPLLVKTIQELEARITTLEG